MIAALTIIAIAQAFQALLAILEGAETSRFRRDQKAQMDELVRMQKLATDALRQAAPEFMPFAPPGPARAVGKPGPLVGMCEHHVSFNETCYKCNREFPENLG